MFDSARARDLSVDDPYALFRLTLKYKHTIVFANWHERKKCPASTRTKTANRLSLMVCEEVAARLVTSGWSAVLYHSII